MFEVFLETFKREKQAMWLDGFYNAYMKDYAKIWKHDCQDDAVEATAMAAFEKGIDIQDVYEFSKLSEDLLSALDALCFQMRVQAAQQAVLEEALKERAVKIAERMFRKGCGLHEVRECTKLPDHLLEELQELNVPRPLL